MVLKSNKQKNSYITLEKQHQQSGHRLSWEWSIKSPYLWPLRRIPHPALHQTEILQEQNIKHPTICRDMGVTYAVYLPSLTFPWRIQRYTDKYCPAEFWKNTLLEGRPVIKLVSTGLSLSVPVMLLLVPPSSLSDFSESDSEPEILDMSPVKWWLKIS